MTSCLSTSSPKSDTVMYINFPDKTVKIELEKVSSHVITCKKLSIENLRFSAMPIDKELNYFYTNLIYDLDNIEDWVAKEALDFWSELVSKSKYYCCGKIKIRKDLSTYVILRDYLAEEALLFNVDNQNFLTSIVRIASYDTYSIIYYSIRKSKNVFCYFGDENPPLDNEIYSVSSFSIDKMGLCQLNE